MIKNIAKAFVPTFLILGCHSTQITNVEQQNSLNNALNQISQRTSLTTQLAQNINLSSAQFIGGSAALLSLAENALTKNNQKELDALMPNLPELSYAQSLTKEVENMSSVQNIFSQLGLSSDVIAQLSPLLLGLLKEEGASSELLSSLNSLWQ